MDPIMRLADCGQSPWLDDLHRTLVRNGELQALIDAGLKGVTSNPAIFEKGIGETDEYVDALAALRDEAGIDDVSAYERLAADDIRGAADLLRPVFERSGGQDGFVSWEVSPYLARDPRGTVEEAKRLWTTVARRNLMIKIPGTVAGLPAIREVIAAGINVNVTLLFSVDAYAAVADAYMSGLEDLVRRGGDPAATASVASFFLSRIDVAVDGKLKERPSAPAALVDQVTDRVAIASAKLAYQHFKEICASPRWRALAAKGAHPQRLLWASTGTKKPSVPDTYYVDRIIGHGTVNTMPAATLAAFRDHGKAVPDTVEDDLDGARQTIAALEELGISISNVTDALVDDGLKKFEAAFGLLLASVAKRRTATGSGMG